MQEKAHLVDKSEVQDIPGVSEETKRPVFWWRQDTGLQQGALLRSMALLSP